jgi:hypothetical protein
MGNILFLFFSIESDEELKIIKNLENYLEIGKGDHK